MTRRATGRAQSLAYWLIARNEHGRIEVLNLDCKQTLPVFSNEDEAEMFLRLEGVADGWQAARAESGSWSRCSAGLVRVSRRWPSTRTEMVVDRTGRPRELGSETLHSAPVGQNGILRAGSRTVATRDRAQE